MTINQAKAVAAVLMDAYVHHVSDVRIVPAADGAVDVALVTVGPDGREIEARLTADMIREMARALEPRR